MVHEAFAKLSAADVPMFPHWCCDVLLFHSALLFGSAPILPIGFVDAYICGCNLHFSFRSATHPVGNTWHPVKFLHKSGE